MFFVSLYGFFCLLITVMFLFLLIIRYNSSHDKEKVRPFECGFDPAGDSRLPFCIKFFLVGVIFLVFDVEVALILPLPFGHAFIVLFMIVLLIGLSYEWYYGGLDWLV